MTSPPELTDGEIIIRPLVADDVQSVYKAARESIAEISPWMSWCHPNYSIQETEQFIASRSAAESGDEWYSFGIFEKENGRFLGCVGLNFINRVHQMANLGYWVRTSATGRGVATAATRLVARYGLESLGFQRVEILAAVENVPSQRVAEKAGAVREAVLRDRLRINGEPRDAILFSLLPKDLGAH